MDSNKPISEEILTEALRQNGISVCWIKSIVGPSYTLYRVSTETGIKIRKVKTLAGKIAETLCVKLIRVVALEDAIGIEINNQQQDDVRFMSFLSRDDFKKGAASMELPVAIGMRVDRCIEVFDLAKLPHLLIAGESKENVSWAMHSVIQSLMYAYKPGYFQTVMLGSRGDSLCIFKDIKNPYMFRIADGKLKGDELADTILEAEIVLQSLVSEMEKRYSDIEKIKCRDIYEYRDKFSSKVKDCINDSCAMPFIVVFIDEYADFIYGKSRQSHHILESILQLASYGRKAGIHLVISTSVINASVISGIIKAIFPAHIALKVSSPSASKLIIDTDEATLLNDNCDALINTVGNTVRVRIGSLDEDDIISILKTASNFLGSLQLEAGCQIQTARFINQSKQRVGRMAWRK